MEAKTNRKRLWTMREVCGYGTPSQTRERILYLLKEGATGINVIFDTPTMTGLDADHPFVEEDVGVQGVSVSTPEDMNTLFDGVPCDKYSTSIVVTSSAAPVLFSWFILSCERREFDISTLRGTIQNDPIHHRWCGYPESMSPLELALQTCCDIIEFCAKNMKKWHPTNINGYDLREWGCDAATEVALAFGIAQAYIDETLKRGLSVDDFAPQIGFYFSANIHFFEEIAKFRAARRIVADLVRDTVSKIMREKYKVKIQESERLKFGVHTAGCSLYGKQIFNNIARVTTETLTAILGGAQSIHSCSFDEPISLPSSLSHRVALRTQQILAYEAKVGDIPVPDPFAGSYYIEKLTDEMEAKIIDVMRKIDNAGGAIEAVKSGLYDKILEESSLRSQMDIEEGKTIIVGVNYFPSEGEEEKFLKFFKIPKNVAKLRRKEVREFKRKRDIKSVRRALKSLTDMAEKSKSKNRTINLIPYIIDAAKEGATLGETLGAVRVGFGYEYDPLDKKTK